MNSKEKIISKFVEFKSKMNLLIALVGEEIQKAKGVNKNVVKIGDIKYFFEVLFNKKVMRHKIKKFNVNYTYLELMMFVKVIHLLFMIKDTN